MTNPRAVSLLSIPLALILATGLLSPVHAGPISSEFTYKILKPIESGDLTLFPVVLTNAKASPDDPFLTLDEGLRSGEVEVTEAGRVHGLVRSRSGAHPAIAQPEYRGDQVNTLVLVNHSQRPLLLLAGEIVTGGKQDRIIAKDRIVPIGADPIDLSVFCIEHGRWTESSDKFGTTANSPAQSFMVQPAVRQQAMVARDQQQVWNSVSNSITAMAAAPPAPSAGAIHGQVTILRPDVNVQPLATTSYAKALQSVAVSAKVDEASSNLAHSREQILATLRQQHAIGVVVAVHGDIIWADLFSNTDLLTRYWTKLIRSYAAEGLTTSASDHQTAATLEDAQHFLSRPMHGAENSEGEAGVYRYSEIRTGPTDQFDLESLLPNTPQEVHISRLKLKNSTDHRPALMY
ncbi:ARPP-1 family domain-containing protein [Granulicella tundricola]|uniref:ARG and Rhodanese-Phosphatase-superfamily-associated domain-containing protein n=1 Tax=Granulicella tundricola (strain ATCC BAA-1859 / DSM 23138 / MP5ACTX9) TaxID=1198114 RepID=E8X666_GRATM|nr:DUF6569 family protein [Granulicella tundricola]ADW70950.1 hypothetical protein AciX9_4170 [Granulicella tundricola MP5ACTX9]